MIEGMMVVLMLMVDLRESKVDVMKFDEVGIVVVI